MDSFFDMPAGYNDADLEMAALEQAGNRAARRYRGITLEQRDELAAGRTISATANRKDGPSYEVQIRATDTDEIGPCGFVYSINGTYWASSPKAARLADLEQQRAAMRSAAGLGTMYDAR